MADYYEVESNGRGGFTVTPRNNSGCLPAIIFVLIVALVFLFSQCGGKENFSNNSSSVENMKDNSLVSMVGADGTLALFSAPYSRSMDSGIELISDSYDHTDLDGRTHDKCYVLLCKGNNQGVVYELDGAFSKLTGELYAQNAGTVCWLEFYNGDSLLFSTEKLSEDNPSCHVNVNVSNVNFLTIYFCSEDMENPMYDSGWLITENFILQ